MLEDPIDRAMVQVINHIGHVMGKRTIAEFVETVEVMEALREIGIDYAQGLAIGAPLPFSRQPPGLGGCPGPVAEPGTEPPVGDRGAKKE